MDVIAAYGNIIKSKMETSPTAARRLIQAALAEEAVRKKIAPDKPMPKAYQELNAMAVRAIQKGFKHPKDTAWTNLFTPVEILQCFGINCLSIEFLSSFISGFTCENWFIDYAERVGIAPTLCSYHKNFIGAVDSGLIPPAAFAVTTSMVCDGNIQTFRHVADRKNVPCYIIDVPDTLSPEAVAYVTSQLKELIALLEDTFHKTFRMKDLRHALERENSAHYAYRQFLKKLQTRQYPSTLTLQMYMLYATHLATGSKEDLRFFEHLAADIETYPVFEGKRILWVHLVPFYQESLRQYFNYGDRYQIQVVDMNLDYTGSLDPANPLDSLSRKMIGNIYNGPYQRKIDFIRKLVDDVNADGVIQFCHWGCKQSAGGSMLLKEALNDDGVPNLILDGDAVDRRNSHDGQIKTRLEAFLEMLNQTGSGSANGSGQAGAPVDASGPSKQKGA